MENNTLEQYFSMVSSSHRVMLHTINTLRQQEETIRQLVNLPATPNTYHERVEEEANTSQSNRTRIPLFYPFRMQASQDSRDRANALSELFSQTIVDTLNNLNPVVVRPTDLQIQQATENMLFSDLPEDIEKVYTCPVSHDTFNNNSDVTRIRHCGHYFGREAIMRWFTINVHCPICRYDIRNLSTEEEDTALPDEDAPSNVEQPTSENVVYYEFDVMY